MNYRKQLVAAICVISTASIATLPSGAGASSSEATGSVGVVVRAIDGHVGAARSTFVALGGDVTRALPIIGGFSGTIGAHRVDDLSRQSAIAAVTLDSDVTPMAIDPTLGYDPASTSSMSAITRIIGAQSMWDAGFTGRGVDVAVIDTGVAKVPGLDQPGKVIDGPDLSFDSQDPALASVDAFGHGTHMAGIIAGSDVAPGTSSRKCKTCLGRSPYTDTTKFVGVAPEARIINVKAGAFDGAADVSQIIAAIDWVVQHRNDPGVNIRVLNLSFGTDSTQSTRLDPLVYAAEQAWKAGIVVVAAAGNDGRATYSLANPALSPAVIAVGASDPNGTLTTIDDLIPAFAQHGNVFRGVDVVAPGVSVVSLRVPGGFVDQNVSVGKVGTRFQQASGTSQATAVVSGLAALLLSKYPSATPDAIKSYLKGTAQPVILMETKNSATDGEKAIAMLVNKWYAGSGSASVNPLLPVLPTIAPALWGTGLGTLEGARGTFHVSTENAQLTGERDIFGSPWNASQMATLTASQTTWAGGTWNGARWSGDTWAGARWSNVAWTNSDWSGARWSGARWSGLVWDGARWSGARWSGARWSAGIWEGARWSGARWSDASWS